MRQILKLVIVLVCAPAFAQFQPASPVIPGPPAAPAAAAAEVVWKGVELEWEEVPKAVGYEVRLTPATGGKPHLFQTTENKLNQQVPVGNYKLQIRAKDHEGEMSPWSAASDLEVAVKEIIPLHPANETLIEAAGSAKQPVEFAWTPVDKVRIYTLKVWSEDKKDNPWIFTGRITKKTLEVPPGRVYYWQVLFESATDTTYNQEPKTFSFTLQGTQLLKPEINPYVAGKDVSWKGSDETKGYNTKLYYRHVDETEWKLVTENSTTLSKLITEKMKAGNYKIEVVATAPRRLSSIPANYEFYVKPTYAELIKDYKLPFTPAPAPAPGSKVSGPRKRDLRPNLASK